MICENEGTHTALISIQYHTITIYASLIISALAIEQQTHYVHSCGTKGFIIISRQNKPLLSLQLHLPSR